MLTKGHIQAFPFPMEKKSQLSDIYDTTLGAVKNSLYPLNKLRAETERFNLAKINECSMESKAFSKSAENRIPPILSSSV